MDCTCFLDLFFDKNLATRYFCLSVIVKIYFLTNFLRNLFAAKIPPKITTADVGSKSKGTGVGAGEKLAENTVSWFVKFPETLRVTIPLA